MTPMIQALAGGGESPAGTEDAQLQMLGEADPEYDPLSNPMVASISSAELPGVSFTAADLQRPDLAKVAANARSLATKLGLNIYTNPKTKVGALFNPEVLRMDEVKAADLAGKLQQLLPPVSKAFPSTEAAPRGAAPASPAPSAGVAPVSRGSQTAITKAKLNELGAPPQYPGAGSTLNALVAGR